MAGCGDGRLTSKDALFATAMRFIDEYFSLFAALPRNNFPTSVLHLQSLFIFNLYFVQFPVQRFRPCIIYAISVRQYWTRRLAPWPQMIRLIPRLILWEKKWWSPKENTFNEIETLRLFEKGNKLTCRIFRTFFKIFRNKFEIFGKKTREFPETYSGEYKWYLSPVI